VTSRYERTASVARVGGFRPPEDPRTSWLGQVVLGKPGEAWPVSEGRPTLGVCQIAVNELPSVPAALEGVAFAALFVDLLGLPDGTPNGDGWELRTYATLEELAPLTAPEREPVPEARAHVEIVLRPFPVAWSARAELPSYEEAADLEDDENDEDDEDDQDDYARLGGFKVGGWAYPIQSKVEWAVSDAELVLQVESDAKTGLGIADAGSLYVGWSADAGWQLSWQSY